VDSCGRLSAGVLHIVDLYNGHRMVGVFGVCVCVCVCYHRLIHASQLGFTVCDLIMATLCNTGGPLYFCPVISIVYRLSFFSSPNLSGHRSDLYYTSTHGVALVQI